MFRFDQNLCEGIMANFYIFHGGFVLQESSLGNVFLSLRCCAWNGQFRVYLNIPVIFAGKLELRFIVQWNIVENIITISSSALRLCCIEKIIQVQNLIAGLLNYVRQLINGQCWVDLWKISFLLTFIIKAHIELIFWDYFFVKILVICKDELWVVSKVVNFSLLPVGKSFSGQFWNRPEMQANSN